MAEVVNITTPGNGQFQLPDGVISVLVRCWGGGGATGGRNSGNGTTSGGAAGGAYAEKRLNNLTPGSVLDYSVAPEKPGGSQNSTIEEMTGNDTWFLAQDSTGCTAKGGQGVAGNSITAGAGTTTGSIGDIVRAGGSGSPGDSIGGAGGGGAGDSGNGGDGSGNTGGSGGTRDGGNGAPGKTATSNSDGSPGEIYGGGAGGPARFTGGNLSGAAGAQGKLEIEYETITVCSHVGDAGNQTFTQNETDTRYSDLIRHYNCHHSLTGASHSDPDNPLNDPIV